MHYLVLCDNLLHKTIYKYYCRATVFNHSTCGFQKYTECETMS